MSLRVPNIGIWVDVVGVDISDVSPRAESSRGE